MNPLTVRVREEAYGSNLTMQMHPYFEAIKKPTLLVGPQFI